MTPASCRSCSSSSLASFASDVPLRGHRRVGEALGGARRGPARVAAPARRSWRRNELRIAPSDSLHHPVSAACNVAAIARQTREQIEVRGGGLDGPQGRLLDFVLHRDHRPDTFRPGQRVVCWFSHSDSSTRPPSGGRCRSDVGAGVVDGQGERIAGAAGDAAGLSGPLKPGRGSATHTGGAASGSVRCACHHGRHESEWQHRVASAGSSGSATSTGS